MLKSSRYRSAQFRFNGRARLFIYFLLYSSLPKLYNVYRPNIRYFCEYKTVLHAYILVTSTARRVDTFASVLSQTCRIELHNYTAREKKRIDLPISHST